MRLMVSSIPESGLEQKFKMSLALLKDEDKADVEVFLKMFRAGDKILINGRAEAGALLMCSRCLEKFSYPLDVKFDVEYIPLQEFIEEPEHELTREELDVSFYKNDQIDIEELVKEHLLLAIPMKPLCKSGCKGICPECGRNLNEDLCGCGKEDVDPRLAPLKEFQKILKSRKE